MAIWVASISFYCYEQCCNQHPIQSAFFCTCVIIFFEGESPVIKITGSVGMYVHFSVDTTKLASENLYYHVSPPQCVSVPFPNNCHQ